ncbi:MAG: hypothetical protein NC924_05165 [Candidatus Omnitrophica bacterium]|nr:hypothetical protein [Candidatus Omnitrophota bacterium]
MQRKLVALAVSGVLVNGSTACAQPQENRVIYEERQGYDSWEQVRRDAQWRRQISAGDRKSSDQPATTADPAAPLSDMPSVRMIDAFRSLAEKLLGPGYSEGMHILNRGGDGRPAAADLSTLDEHLTGGHEPAADEPYQWQGLRRD